MSSLANIAGRLMQIHRSLAEPPTPVPLNVDRVPRIETRFDYGHPGARPRLARRASRTLWAPPPAAAARWPSLEASMLLEDAVTRFKTRNASPFPEVARVDGRIPAADQGPLPEVAEVVEEASLPEPVEELTLPPSLVAPPDLADAEAIEPASLEEVSDLPTIEPEPRLVDPEAVAAWILIHLGELLSRIPPSPTGSEPTSRREPEETVREEPPAPIRLFLPPTPPEPVRFHRPEPLAPLAESSLDRFLLFPGIPEELRNRDLPGVPAELLFRAAPQPAPVAPVQPPVNEVLETPKAVSPFLNPLDWLLIPDVDRPKANLPGRHPLDCFFTLPLPPDEPSALLLDAFVEPEFEELLAAPQLLLPIVPTEIEPEVEAMLGAPLHRLFSISHDTEEEEEEIVDEAPREILSLPAPPDAEEFVDEVPHWLIDVPAEPEDEPNVDEPMDWLFSTHAEPFVMLYRGEHWSKTPSRPTDDQIRRRAYELWQAAGSPPSDGREFWIAALRDLGLAS
ncbi:DUF2934 domain-containing protein [Paludisphaera rhizosphaerae]|uniref:DUF2934 domain-containing protein n=1 Tax=Paludisphaera rhizosphaerae TaxID=2711216 RepID=UPI0013EC330C|nr:DUF2934 domain-containing protein [Paludisphaera rhizosphaerae]